MIDSLGPIPPTGHDRVARAEADGRHSVVRKRLGLLLVQLKQGFDVLWSRGPLVSPSMPKYERATRVCGTLATASARPICARQSIPLGCRPSPRNSREKSSWRSSSITQVPLRASR